ncbi:hypothetical protein BN1110_04905 [bacterium YEK0313]|nr:hypothetical protein BN1110_04905 [bacterium YEK0313]
MQTLSALFYVITFHPFWAWLAIIAVAIAAGRWLARATGRNAWYALVPISVVVGMLNLFTGHMLNAIFLNAFGTIGSGVIIQSRMTSSTLNDQNIWDYDVVLRTADGQDIAASFDTLSASNYPVRNEILIPPPGERFVTKYIPGFERNFAIMTDLSAYGIRRNRAIALEPLRTAEARLRVSPANPTFIEGYRTALRAFIDEHGADADPVLLAELRRKLQEIDMGAAPTR